ncbi:MAG TPA: hypothetical protein VK968_20565, partial [Roseimicrobium sp.]|nr:hypothetical protein [Roseimicrobium sp.]
MRPTVHTSFCALMLLLLSLTTGCSSHPYVAPGAPANIRGLGATEHQQSIYTDGSISSQFTRKPLAQFPAYVAAVRIQGQGYTSRTFHGDGFNGKFTVLTNREVETDAQFERLSKLPMMGGVAPVNKMLVTGPCNTEEDLRQLGARVHADMVLVYTFDTQFYVKDYATPVTIVSLGLSPNKAAKVTTTASALLIDTRSGYIYGLAEATADSS